MTRSRTILESILGLAAVAGVAVTPVVHSQAPARSSQVDPVGEGGEDPIAAGGDEQGAVAPRGRRDRSGGGASYEQFCAGCHGPNLEGGSATSLIDDEWLFGGTEADILESITDGRPGTPMVAFGELLDDHQIWQLLVYIRQQKDRLGDRPATIVDPDGHVVESEKQAFRFEVVARDLNTPWGIAFLPDGRMLVTERPGAVRLVEDGVLRPDPVAGTPTPWAVQDGGFLDVEVHPDYARNGWIYLSYAQPGPGNWSTTERGEGNTSMTRVVRGRIRDYRWVDEESLFEGGPELFSSPSMHYGSRFIFDQKGKLLFSIGDRGRMETAQDLTSPLGKVHRVNDDGTVPDDNPFVGRPDAVPTIWSYGHRNPQGFSIDPVNGLIWEAEHGPIGGDELNIIEPGLNYGWGVISHGIQQGIARRTAEGMESPIVHWTPAIAPSAIHFYGGTRYPRWKNDLFVTGLAGTALRRLEVSGRRVTHQEVLFNSFGRVRDVVTGPDGLLYVALQLPGRRLSSSTPGVVVRLMPVE